MQFKRSLSLFFIVLTSGLSVHAQVPVKNDCPTITVSAPASVTDGSMLSFSANVSKGDVTYNWSISAGTISSGQGTPSITIDTKGLGGQNITATVDLGGLDRSCSTTASATVTVDQPKPEVTIYDKGNYTTKSLYNIVIDRFVKDLDFIMKDGLSIKHVIIYPGKDAKGATAVKDMILLTKAAFKKAGMSPLQFSIVTGGRRDQSSYEFYSVPSDATPPVPDPAK